MSTLSFTELTAKVVTEYPEYIQNVDLIEAKLVVGYLIETKTNPYSSVPLLSILIDAGDVKNICEKYRYNRLSDFEYKILAFSTESLKYRALVNIKEVYNYLLSSLTDLLSSYSLKCDNLKDWVLRAVLKRDLSEIYLISYYQILESEKGLSECKEVIDEYLSSVKAYLLLYTKSKKYFSVNDILSNIDPKVNYVVHYECGYRDWETSIS